MKRLEYSYTANDPGSFQNQTESVLCECVLFKGDAYFNFAVCSNINKLIKCFAISRSFHCLKINKSFSLNQVNDAFSRAPII